METAGMRPTSMNVVVDAEMSESQGRQPVRTQTSTIIPVDRSGRPSLTQIPASEALQAAFHQASVRLTAQIPEGWLVKPQDLETLGRRLLKEAGEPESYLGFAMVLLGNSLWKRRFLSVPYHRRLLLLPDNLSHACGASHHKDLNDCDSCLIDDFRNRAERLGYAVLMATSTPAVFSKIIEQDVDAILGVASLDDLEKAFNRGLLSGVPSFAVPLSADGKSRTPLETTRIDEVLERYEPLSQSVVSGYVPLMRSATKLFREDFSRLLPRVRSATPADASSPLGVTEDAAYDWLANGGKRFRPFITLASYDAATGGARCIQKDAGMEPPPFPDAVCRVAMAIEAFHKASLVHDDIQDDDLFRYGRDTLHRSHGLGPAINIGDYLIGLGYRLVNSCAAEFGGEIATDIVSGMSLAHLRLCDGQGAEMAWRDHPDWTLTPRDALRIYALKTSPAFEAALYAGLRMAGPVGDFAEQISQFCQQLGIGFQILNDLKDWEGDCDNKLIAGQDALALRPTVLLALALESSGVDEQVEIRSLLETSGDDQFRLERLRKLFAQAGAFEQAEVLVETARSRSEAIARSAEPEPLCRLLEFLVETVLRDERTPRDQQIGALPATKPSV